MSKTELVHGARVTTAERRQVEWTSSDLDSLIAEDHRARAIWNVVEKLDLSAFYAGLQVRETTVGRSATDPKILLALWIFATSEGIGSARRLAELCRRDAPYRWICGGVSTNHHTLGDFRVEHGEAIDGLMTKVIAALMHNGLLKIRRVAQDGMRVRACAGAASFRRRVTLEECAVAARARIDELRRELDAEPHELAARERAARARAAKERSEAIERALAEMPKVEETKARGARKSRSKSKKTSDPSAGDDDKKSAPRVSTTDPTARVMKMADGGFRPAYNVQIATDTESRFIIGVDVTNAGGDSKLMKPMLDEIERRTGHVPHEHLVDGGFNSHEQIDLASKRDVTVYAPVNKPRAEKPTTKRGRNDTPHVAAWRRRMETAEAKEIYKRRGSTVETINGDLRRWRGLDRFVVRGLAKVTACARLAALTYNLLRWIELAA